MTSDALLGRALGALSTQSFASAETSRLLHSIQAAPGIRFDGYHRDIKQPARQSAVSGSGTSGGVGEQDGKEEQAVWAHKAGVNTLTIDRFEGRYLLTGASSSTVSLWDLEQCAEPDPGSSVHGKITSTATTTTYHPLTSTPPSTTGTNYGITSLSFYPFDSGAFLRSSYDHTLALYATDRLADHQGAPSASFNLDSVIYNHAISPIATHLLVACATQHPSVRLVDLRSGASGQYLAPGHEGGAAVLACAWSPTEEYILASGGADGVVKLWDVRRGKPCLGVLDLEDSVGVRGEDGFGLNAREKGRGRAHVGACNGVVWSGDGRWVVTAGHDERVRVWDVAVGANALSHFGPVIQNRGTSGLVPLLVPLEVGKRGESIMVYPNERELLMFDLFEGTLLKRLKVPPGKMVAQARGGGGTNAAAVGERNIRNRVTGLAWRAGEVEIYSSHSDGVVRAWKPKTRAESELEREEALSVEEEQEGEDDGRKRKRQALDDVFRELTKQKITFT